MENSLKTVYHYHDATKHHFGRYAKSLGYMDWDRQPDPFRTYQGAPQIKLETVPPTEQPAFDAVFAGDQIESAPLSHRSISQLFFDSMAISAWKKYGLEAIAKRVNPSSGNLHPTESYLLCGPVEGLTETPTVCHYSPKEHVLEKRASVPAELWEQLTATLPKDAILVGLSSIFWRESWKYGERAFRYCNHDVGHALGAITIAAAGMGWQVRLIDELSYEQMRDLMGLPVEDGPEIEHPDCVVAIFPYQESTGTTEQTVAKGTKSLMSHAESSETSVIPTLQPESTNTSVVPTLQSETINALVPPTLNIHAITSFATLTWQGEPNKLSPSHVPWPIIDTVADATRKPATQLTYAGKPSTPLPPQLGDTPHRPLREIIRKRRSAIEMDGQTRMSLDQFYNILSRTVAGADNVPFNVLPWEPLTHLLLFVHRVDDLEPGIYMLVRYPEHKEKLQSATRPDFLWQRADGCPQGLDLYLLSASDVRDLARAYSCDQNIAADSCFSLGMLVEFERPLQEYGAWFYPRLYWETGLIGQVLYLEAEAATGLRGTGIGCFMDDPVHKLIGLHDKSYQSLYHFTIGGPLEDVRIVDVPVYENE